jgi:hypothetical protein
MLANQARWKRWSNEQLLAYLLIATW